MGALKTVDEFECNLCPNSIAVSEPETVGYTVKNVPVGNVPIPSSFN